MLEYRLVPPFLIAFDINHLVSGYDRLSGVDNELKRRYRQPLLETYAQQNIEYEKKLAIFQKQYKRRKVILAVLAGIVCFTILIGLIAILTTFAFKIPPEWLSSLLCAGPILCFAGLGFAIILGGLFFYWPSKKPPEPPLNPLHDEIPELFPSLVPAWKETMRSQLLEKYPDDGYTGEKLLINAIQQLDMTGYLLHRLVQKAGDDLDLVLVGSKGIWLFEVKYWSGTITHDQGHWRKHKKYFRKGGVERTDQRTVTQPPELQWKRMRDELVYTLSRHAPALLKRYANMTTIQGGVVFTHPGAEIDIPKGAGFSWGNIPFWINCLKEAEPDVNFQNERLLLTITELLISRHQEVEKISSLRSMEDYAEIIISQSDQHLQEWINQNKIQQK